MSAVPDNVLTFGSWDTLPTDLPTGALSFGSPDNLVDTPKSDGVTWSGILSGVSATADALTSTFGKVYAINSAVENAKFAQTVNAANQQLKVAHTMGTLDIQRATLDANVAIEKARAARATSDAIAQVNSGSAGYVKSGGISPLVILGGLALVGAVLFMRRGKA